MQVVQDLQNVCTKVRRLGHTYSCHTKNMVFFLSEMSGEDVIMLVL